MKKLFIILGALFIGVFVLWRFASRQDENVTQESQLPGKSETDLVAPGQGQREAPLAPHIALPDVTNMVFTAYVATATGMFPILRTQSIPLNISPTLSPTPEAAQAARQSWRQELREKAEYKDIFAKEDEWKEKAKALEPGLIMSEAIKTMGAQPTSRINIPGGQTLIYYSPDGRKDTFWSSGNKVRLPVDQLSVLFDSDGKLKELDWH